MALIKKIDVNEHFAARRRMRLAAAGFTRRPAAAGLPVPETAGRKADAAGFKEDVHTQHSSPSVPATPAK